MNATELIKRGIAMTPFFVSVIAYGLLISAQSMQWWVVPCQTQQADEDWICARSPQVLNPTVVSHVSDGNDLRIFESLRRAVT